MSMSQSDDEEEEEHCPLCCETLDITDRNFFPCPCEYQICCYCWNHIKENLNRLCPACRTPYADDPHNFSPVDLDEIMKKRKEKKKRDRLERRERERERDQKEREKNDRRERELARNEHDRYPHKAATAAGYGGQPSGISPTTGLPIHSTTTTLRNIRVVQRNLAYVLGLPPSLASEETLRKGEYFGQYGKIVKVAVTRPAALGGSGATSAGCCAYVTFAHKEDARACIQALDNFVLPPSLAPADSSSRPIRASFGTTKYCNTFLRYVPCNNPECLFLHEAEDDSEGWTREEAQAWQVIMPGSTPGTHVLVGQGGPSGTGKRVAHPVFPPPRWEEPLSDPSTGGAGGAATATVTAAGTTKPKPHLTRPPANPWQQHVATQQQQQQQQQQQPTPAQAALLSTSSSPSRAGAGGGTNGMGLPSPSTRIKASTAAAKQQQQQQQQQHEAFPPPQVPLSATTSAVAAAATAAAAVARGSSTAGPESGGTAARGGGREGGTGGFPPPPPGIVSPPQPPALPPGILPFDLGGGEGGREGGSTGGLAFLFNGGGEGGGRGEASPPSSLFNGEDRLGGIGGMPLPGVREGGREGGRTGAVGGASGPMSEGKTIRPPVERRASGRNGGMEGGGGRGRGLFANAGWAGGEEGEELLPSLAPPRGVFEKGEQKGNSYIDNIQIMLQQQQQQQQNPLFPAFPFPGPGPLTAAAPSAVAPPPLSASSATSSSSSSGGGSSAPQREPFTATESLAHLLGLKLPRSSSSLPSRGHYAIIPAQTPLLQSLPPPHPSSNLPSSRYSFAKDEGGGGGGVDELLVSGGTKVGHSHRPQHGGGGGGFFPIRVGELGGGVGGKGGGGGRAAGGAAGGAGGVGPSLQSGVALLQQLLPNCSITYGAGATKTSSSSVPSSVAPAQSGDMGGNGGNKKGKEAFRQSIF
ncbi:ring zinc finger-containing protein [Nannochloropsis oceanica]